MLSGLEIKKHVEDGSIIIDPFNPDNIGPNSYDLRLGNTISVYTKFRHNNTGIDFLDVKDNNNVETSEISNDGIVLFPNQLYLAHTMEKAGSNHFVPCIEGRSSIARLGIQVHMTAGFGDIGFIGQWTLEIRVALPVKVYSGMRICQIYFQNIVGEYSLYNGKYKDSVGVIPSKIYEDFNG